MLAFHDFTAEVKGLKAFAPSERPPVTLSFISFRVMLMLGFFFLVMAIIGWLRRNTIEDQPCLLKVFLFSIPLPYVASELGWMLAEVGQAALGGLRHDEDLECGISDCGLPGGDLFWRIRAGLHFSGIGGLLPDLGPCEERAGR